MCCISDLQGAHLA